MFTSLTETNPASEYPNAPSKSCLFNDSSINSGGYFISEILVALALIFVEFSRCNGIEQVTSALQKYASIFGEIDKFWTISSSSDYLEPCKSQLPTLQKILAPEETAFFHRICRCPASILVQLPIDNSGFASFYADRDTDTFGNCTAGDSLRESAAINSYLISDCFEC
ncbi:hypothetical protein IQ269_03925 [Tychonema sp. LEGE 07199]|uniref:hypothetical protein n=1 Tax=unclassified Tychonema TaxID=2642144 RepID=UPI00187E72FC|nr:MULTISPECIES: hypothetical protein [unclassified Tychonema]MBE9119973.1 hypothetical protein [Tychonema sp. LEGE 07199]MBE9134479.1 hypothetical protein [Tychonema sp. LEGE 07196]